MYCRGGIFAGGGGGGIYKYCITRKNMKLKIRKILCVSPVRAYGTQWVGPVSNASLHLHNISSLFKYFKRKGNEKSQIKIAYEIPREKFLLRFHQDPFRQSLSCPSIIIITVNLQIFCLQISSGGHCKFSPRNIPPTCTLYSGLSPVFSSF